MDFETKTQIRNSFVLDADSHLREAESHIKAALHLAKHYEMGCAKELEQSLEALNVSRKTLNYLAVRP